MSMVMVQLQPAHIINFAQKEGHFAFAKCRKKRSTEPDQQINKAENGTTLLCIGSSAAAVDANADCRLRCDCIYSIAAFAWHQVRLQTRLRTRLQLWQSSACHLEFDKFDMSVTRCVAFCQIEIVFPNNNGAYQ